MSTRDEELEPTPQLPRNDEKGVEDVEEAIAYLEALTAREKAVEEDASAGSTIPMDESLAAEDLPAWVTELPSEIADSGDPSLSWLENISQKNESAERPTEYWPAEQIPPAPPIAPPIETENSSSTINSQATPIENVEDAMAWLDELAANHGTPLEEMQTIVISPEDQNLAETPKVNEKPNPIAETPPVAANITDDPMAWLEQLAADQNTPLEELPSVAMRLLASEIISQVDEEGSIVLPIALEEALYFLEDKISEKGLSLDEVLVPPKSNMVDMATAFKQVDQLVAGKVDALTDLSFADTQSTMPQPSQKTEKAPNQDTVSSGNDLPYEMPNDPDEALAWLEGLAHDPQALAAATAVDATKTHPPEIVPIVEKTTPSTEQEEKPLPQEDDILAEMPEDPDEAMAWYDKVAAKQSVKDVPPTDEKTSTQFTAINQALAEGDIEQAAAIYHEILQEDSMLPQAIDSLATAVANNPTSGQLRHLLGDAYMRQGQMQKALEVYRQGFLDHL